MRGAIAGDIVGSRWHAHRIRPKQSPPLETGSAHTEISVLTLALARWALDDPSGDPTRWVAEYIEAYPANYDLDLIASAATGAGSLTNDDGAASRIAVCGWVASSLEEACSLAERASLSTLADADAVLAAQSVAATIYMGRDGRSPEQIAAVLRDRYGYRDEDLRKTVKELAQAPFYTRHASISVPAAVICALRASSVTEAVWNVISLNGDSSRQAAIAGAVAEAVHGIDEDEFVPAFDHAAAVSPAGRRAIEEIRGLLDRIPSLRRRWRSRLRIRRLR